MKAFAKRLHRLERLLAGGQPMIAVWITGPDGALRNVATGEVMGESDLAEDRSKPAHRRPVSVIIVDEKDLEL